MMIRLIIFISFLFATNGVYSKVYHLNDTDYERMPPIYGLDCYEECVKNRGIYVFGKFELYYDEENELYKMIRDYSNHKLTNFNHSVIDRGICLSSTCKQYIGNKNVNNATDLKSILEECLSDTLYQEYGTQVNLISMDKGYLSEHSSVDTTDWRIFFIALLLLFLNITGSIYDTRTKNNNNCENVNEYLRCFSIFLNWKSLVEPIAKDNNAEWFCYLDGLRVLLSCLVVTAHVMLLDANIVENAHSFEKGYNGPFMIFANGLSIIQMYFVISGALLVFNLKLKYENKKTTWKIFFRSVMRRLVRLIPSYYLIFFFTSTWLRHLSSGPVWDHYVTDMSIVRCRPFWLHHMFLINNYFFENRCTMHFWYIAADTQLFILTLALYMILKPNWYKWVLSTSILIGIVSPALHVIFQELEATSMFTPELLRNIDDDSIYLMHFKTHNNIASCTIGAITGAVIYKIRNKNLHFNHRMLLSAIEILSLVSLVALPLLGLWTIENTTPYIWKVMYAALHRTLIALLASLLGISMALKTESIIRPILEWKRWKVLAKLTYSVYLIHYAIIYVILGSRQQLHHTSTSHFIINQLYVMVLSYLFALPLHLLVESPMIKLFDMILDKSKENVDKKTK